ncbi:LysE family translocator [Orrella sp. NBD-18]|uniref:LysE family translocator n=1 Tax=Sheuella amnicola TaxID=2707330 RepID=A0A6B2QVF4_9BURK|nr:LysE family translocator [Sheuella amnicola]NDY82131.1 LysE family translocator [Sheuella amnicola]
MTFISFLFAACLLAITPGPGLAYVVARTVNGGRQEGLASCLGTSLGGMVHVLASSLGLSLIIAESAMAFNLLKYIGAAYLVYLGIRILRRDEQLDVTPTNGSQGCSRAFTEGIVVESLNVKTALFFLAFLPQFVSPNEPLIAQLVLLGCICVMLNTLVDIAAVFAAHRLIKSDLARTARARLLNRLSGVTIIGIGTFLALTRRET